MGLNLDTGAVTDYAVSSPYYEEAEGADPAGRYVLVERDLTVTLFPGMLDIWRLPLDGSGEFERLTTFDYYRGFGANNPVVSPDGTLIAFSLKVEGEEGEGDGILLLDLTAPAASAAPAHPLPAAASTTVLVAAGALVAAGRRRTRRRQRGDQRLRRAQAQRRAHHRSDRLSSRRAHRNERQHHGGEQARGQGAQGIARSKG